MGWKDKLTKSPHDPAQNALERIRAASAQHDEAPQSKWDALSDPVLETYAAAEEVLRPHAEAGTLAPEMILASGRHVGGVHFHPYDGAGEAWAERVSEKENRLVRSGLNKLGAYDVERVLKHIREHASDYLLAELAKDLEYYKMHRDEIGEAEQSKSLAAWLEKPAHQKALNAAIASAFSYYGEYYVDDVAEWFTDACKDIATNGIHHRRTIYADDLATVPTEKFSQTGLTTFLSRSLAPLEARIHTEIESGLRKTTQHER